MRPSVRIFCMYAFARMGNVPPNKDAAQDDLYLGCSSASPRAITSKRRSDDLDNVAHACSKKARLASICMPLTDVEMTSMSIESDQALKDGTQAQVVAHDSIATLSRNDPCGEDGIKAIVIGMLCSKFSCSLFERYEQMTFCISMLVIVRVLSDRIV